jgi:hypothetical protein
MGTPAHHFAIDGQECPSYIAIGRELWDHDLLRLALVSRSLFVAICGDCDRPDCVGPNRPLDFLKLVFSRFGPSAM